MEISKTVLDEETINIWKETEPYLRKDKVGRECFKELLKLAYNNVLNTII